MTKVALVYNLVQPDILRNQPIDSIAELDSVETIRVMATALEAGGHRVTMIEANADFVDRLKLENPEIVFNVAEGLHDDARESQVPAICDFFGIPYTGSGVFSLSICLNKARSYEILTAHGLNVPPYQVFNAPDDSLALKEAFPLIVKLLHEGSSMGLSARSIVKNEEELISQVQYLFDLYAEPLLVQKFITGREFTVGLIGNQEPLILPVTEVVFPDPYGIVMFNPNEEILPLIEQVIGKRALKEFLGRVIPHQSICPAHISSELASRIAHAARTAFTALECRDWCRVDFRLDEGGRLYVLELNPIAGLAPGDWLPNSAEALGLDYTGLINRILDTAIQRISAD